MRRRVTQVSVDGRPGVMVHDPGTRQTEIRVDGWLWPDGPGSTVYLAGGVPAGTPDFVVAGGRIRPRPVPPPPGPLIRMRQALRGRRRLLTIVVVAAALAHRWWDGG